MTRIDQSSRERTRETFSFIGFLYSFEFFPFLNSFFPFCISSSIVSSLIFSVRSLMLETRTESSRKESHRSVLVGHYDCLRRPLHFVPSLFSHFLFCAFKIEKKKPRAFVTFTQRFFMFRDAGIQAPLLCVHISL